MNRLIVPWHARRASNRRVSRPLVLLGAALTSWLILAVSAPSNDFDGPVMAARVALGVIIACTAATVLVLRLRATSTEREMWYPAAVAGIALAIGILGQSAFALASREPAPAHTSWAALFAAPPILIAGGAIYRGLVSWNRFRTSLSNPADWLNGFSAVFAMASIANVLVQAGDSGLARWDGSARQAWLLATASIATALGTLPTVASLAVLFRDPRVWLIGTGLAAACAGQVVSLAMNQPLWRCGSWAQTGWLILLVALAWAATLRRQGTRTQPSTTLATVIGTMVVLACSIAALAYLAVSSVRNEASAILALAACIGAGAQGGRIIRELDQLAQSRREARTDDLTGAANRRELLSRLNAAIDSGDCVAVAMIDLDHFKAVNDRYGHAMGDQLIQRMAHRILQNVPGDALLARLGGDEFAVKLRDTSLAQAEVIARQLHKVISEVAYIDDHLMSVGVSIGITGLPAGQNPTGADGSELLRQADVAMYSAKRSGLGVRTYAPSLDVQLKERAEMADQLRTVLTHGSSAGNGIVTEYQPKVAADGRVVGLEALVRWDHPDRGRLAPDAFLDIVEEHGLMMAMTSEVFEQAARFAAELSELGTPLRMSVNVSAGSLADPALVVIISETLKRTKLPASLLVVEITETAFMANAAQALEGVRQIAVLGVDISIDDFGTGYSSLAYLDTLMAQELKLDRSLVSKIVQSARTAVIVAGTIELAHRLGLRVVAEGVEDQQTHEALIAVGCDEMQGYFFARPLPPVACAELLGVRSLPVRPRTASSLAAVSDT